MSCRDEGRFLPFIPISFSLTPVQATASLHGCSSTTDIVGESEMLEDFESDEEEFEEEKCLLCKKSCYSTNQLIADQIKRCQTAMKISKKM